MGGRVAAGPAIEPSDVSKSDGAADRAHERRRDEGADRGVEHVRRSTARRRQRARRAPHHSGRHRSGLRSSAEVWRHAVDDDRGAIDGRERSGRPRRAGTLGPGGQPVLPRRRGGDDRAQPGAADQLRVRRDRRFHRGREVPGCEDHRHVAVPDGRGRRGVASRRHDRGVRLVDDRWRRLHARREPALARRARRAAPEERRPACGAGRRERGHHRQPVAVRQSEIGQQSVRAPRSARPA